MTELLEKWKSETGFKGEIPKNVVEIHQEVKPLEHLEEMKERLIEQQKRYEATPHYHLCDRSVMNGFSRLDPRVPVRVCGGCPACIKYLMENDTITPLSEMEVCCKKDTDEYFFTDKNGNKRKLSKNSLHRIARAQGLQSCKICYVN